ncbi:MAG: hypothetical protein MJ137_09230 [Clostridia bacterium]|nr:hypothetical protein [Clostridia bacterium]
MKPLFKSRRESFSRDFYRPQCPVIAAPVVITECDLIYEPGAFPPPQNLIIHVGTVFSGEDAECLYSILDATRNVFPIIYLDSAEIIPAVVSFLESNRVYDVGLCGSFDKPALLRKAYELAPYAHIIADCRGIKLPEDIASLPGMLSRRQATSVILDMADAMPDTVHALEQRFIHVISDCRDAADGEQLLTEATSAVYGVNGIITDDPASLYVTLSRFPENTFLRRRNLVGHKGFQNDGTYSENTISGVVAAGDAHLDGAEIDVKLSGDGVAMVMHSLDTRGMFDVEPPLVTELADFDKLSSLRRIKHPNEGVDRFDDLMFAMADYPETPVVIELKPRACYHRLDEMVDFTKELLKDERCQKNPVVIFGADNIPDCKYIRKHLPSLPFAAVTAPPKNFKVPVTRKECEDLLYAVTAAHEGLASAYNPEDTGISRTFNEYAKIRHLTVFPWSRSWILAPSLWETNGPKNDKTFMAGYDAWTTDHAEMYLDLPVGLEISSVAPDDDEIIRPEGLIVYRDGSTRAVSCGLCIIDGDVTLTRVSGGYKVSPGTFTAVLTYRSELHFGDYFYTVSEPFTFD